MTNAPAYIISWERFSDDGKIAANGQPFNHTNLTCATRLFPFGTKLRIVDCHNLSVVEVTVTDRTAKRFARRIDLSPAAFAHLNGLALGICEATVTVEK